MAAAPSTLLYGGVMAVEVTFGCVTAPFSGPDLTKLTKIDNSAAVTRAATLIPLLERVLYHAANPLPKSLQFAIHAVIPASALDNRRTPCSY